MKTTNKSSETTPMSTLNIREGQKRKAEEKLEALLLAGLNSGAARAMTAKDWAEIRQTVGKKMAQRKSACNVGSIDGHKPTQAREQRQKRG
jgi:hypothetical protein